MAEVDLIKLYSQRMLALASDIPHAELLAQSDASASARSPLCGSVVSVDVVVEGERLADLGMDVKACALGQASAAILGAGAVGLTRADIAKGRDALRRILKEDAPAPEPDFLGGAFRDLEVMTAARAYPNRHASILLAWDATLEAMDQATTPSVEAALT